VRRGGALGLPEPGLHELSADDARDGSGTEAVTGGGLAPRHRRAKWRPG
jgi:hypothetical protein